MGIKPDGNDLAEAMGYIVSVFNEQAPREDDKKEKWNK